jgi:tetratricopeptide (TPR) repeat protein
VDVPTMIEVISAVLHLAVLLGAAAIATEVVCRIGAGILPILSARMFTKMERFGLSLLLGWMAVGTGYLGLAYAGLFRPVCLIGFPLVMLAISRAAKVRRSVLLDALSESRMAGATGLFLLGSALAPSALRMLTFDNDWTCFLYHLGCPWHYLLAGRALLENVPWFFHLPMPFDISMALPLLFGDDRMTKWQAASFLAAAGAVYAGGRFRAGRTQSAWLGPLLATSIGYVTVQLGSSKNDLPAAALFVAGALSMMKGGNILGALLLGCSSAVKLTNVPLALLWIACTVPARRWRILVLPAALPLLPWFAGSFLVTGNPVFPFASSLIPTHDWGRINAAVSAGIMHNAFGGDYSLSSLPSTWIAEMRREYLLVLLLVPGLLIFGCRRRLTATCLLAMVMIFSIRHEGRYLLPPAIILCLLAAEEIERGRDRFRRAILWIVPAYCVIRSLAATSLPPDALRGMIAGANDLAQRPIPYQADTLKWLADSKCGKVLSVGETRTYLFPCRLIHCGNEGETPLIWKLARESRDTRELAVKIHQLGAEFILYNYVTVEWHAMSYRIYRWDDRMVGLYRVFCSSYLVLAHSSATCDFTHGGYYVYRILPAPSSHPPRLVWAAPGMDPLYGEGMTELRKGNTANAVRLLTNVREKAPTVGQCATQLGLALEISGDYAGVVEVLRPFVESGMVDAYNLLTYGRACLRTGRLDPAESALQEAVRRYPDKRDFITVNLAQVGVERVVAETRRERRADAERHAAEAETLLRSTPESGEHSTARRHTLTMLMLARAVLAEKTGNIEEAISLIRKAISLSPDHPDAASWKAMIDVLTSRNR